MAKPLHLLDEAVTEGQLAWKWYRDRSERAAQRFRDAIEAALREIQEDPSRWPKYLLDTRFFQLKKFPYLLVFREMEASIQVIAIAHAHRRPGYWKKRTRKNP